MQSNLLTDSFSREQVASLPKMIGCAVRLILLSRIESQFGLARRIGADAQRHRTTACAVAAWTLTWTITGAIVVAAYPSKLMAGLVPRPFSCPRPTCRRFPMPSLVPVPAEGPTMPQLEHAPAAH
jgi:hypothetical protein